MKIHCFIFNWPGKTPYAKTLEQQLTNIGYYPTVINSDPDYQPFNWINLGNQAYFGAQWHLAVSLFQADLFFHVQADTEYQDWQGVFDRALKYKKTLNWGVWAPDFQENTFWAHPLPQWNHADSNLQLVPNSDCTCWFIDGGLISEFRTLGIDWKTNFYGWGMDSIICSLSYINTQPVIRDTMHQIMHHPGRGYDTTHAYNHMQQMFSQLNPDLRKVIELSFANSSELVNYVR